MIQQAVHQALVAFCDRLPAHISVSQLWNHDNVSHLVDLRSASVDHALMEAPLDGKMLTETITPNNTLPSFCQARVLILGVGNVLFGDDGFGPAVVESLIQDYTIPDDVYVMDVGTGVRKLLFTLTLSEIRPEQIVIIDAVDWNREIGLISEIPVESLPTTKLDDFSMHHAPTSNLLRELQEQCGVKVTVIVCDVGPVPQVIQPGLSAITRQAVLIACQQIAGHLSIQPK